MNTINHGDRIGNITEEEYKNTIKILRGYGIVVADGLGNDTYHTYPYITWVGMDKNRITASRSLVSESRRMKEAKVYNINEFLHHMGINTDSLVFNNGNGLKHNFI